MDDPSSLKSFFDWMRIQVNSTQSPAPTNGETVHEETQSPIPESRSNGSVPEDPRPYVDPVQYRSSQAISNGTAPTFSRTSQTNEDEADHRSIPHSASLARPPVVSVAHKFTNPTATPPISKLANVSRVEPNPGYVAQTQPPQATEHKVIFRYRNALPNPFNKQDYPEIKKEETTYDPSRQGAAASREIKIENKAQYHTAETASPKKGKSLLDSVYAPQVGKGHQSSMIRDQQNPQHTSTTSQEHDGTSNTMRYFDDKHKQYYPTSNTINGSSKVMLQSKDPNASMKSPNKAAGKLNPEAGEYHSSVPTKRSFDVVAEVDEGSMSSATATPVAETEPDLAEIDLKDEPAAADIQSDTRVTLDEVKVLTPARQGRPTKITEDSFVICQDEHQSDDRLDLTPMLNVLGARNLNVSETNGQQKKDNKASAMIEKEESPVVSVAEVPSEQDTPDKAISRTLMVKNLPRNSSYTLVQSLIHGATIMSMTLMQDKHQAQVQLTDTDDCRKVVESCKNGVEIKHHGTMHKVFIEHSREVSEDDELLEIYLNCGATRAVQAEGVDLDLTMRSLWQVASGASSREVEEIIDSYSGGIRRVVFRLTSIQDAVALRSSLRRDINWKTKKIEFVDNPCA